MASSSSSSSIIPQSKYDVFLNFRGEDTRDNFTSHLYAALVKKKIQTFIDVDGLNRGDEIAPVLLEAIEVSKISVIIFSENYASSRWCLDELVKILECRKMYGQMVMPIFYHINPYHVRNQTGSFGKAFAWYENDFKRIPERVQMWRAALIETSNLSGWDSMVIRPESVLVEKIVDHILRRLNELSMGYDVFLSFSGIDTRKNFTNHLYNALKQERINVFIDDNELERGKPIAELFQAIEQSRFSIIIFSKNYASSIWCMDELVKIVECMETGKHIILPVFYDVGPDVVMNQEGEYKEKFVYHERENKEKVQNWRNAMKKVSNLSGWDVKDRYESEVIQELVTAICREKRYKLQ